MAHSDVVPVDRSQWTVDPFAAIEKGGYIYGRGAEDDKQLLAAELAVLGRSETTPKWLSTGISSCSLEADEEAGARGATWVVEHAFPKIDAEFAINEYSYTLITPSGIPVGSDPDRREDSYALQAGGARHCRAWFAAARR